MNIHGTSVAVKRHIESSYTSRICAPRLAAMVLFLLAISSTNTFGAEYYVATDGDDGVVALEWEGLAEHRGMARVLRLPLVHTK